MFNSAHSPTLSKVARQFSRRLGATWAPRVRITPGAQCSYSPFFHRISIGEDVISQGSVEMCCAILAHEVGHSVQPELRMRAWCQWGYIAGMLYACLPIVAVVLLGLEGKLGYFFALSSLPIIPVTHWLTTKLNKAYLKNALELEIEADQYAAELVGQEAACDAFIEYSRLFCNGMTDENGLARIDHLLNPTRIRGRKVRRGWNVFPA